MLALNRNRHFDLTEAVGLDSTAAHCKPGHSKQRPGVTKPWLTGADGKAILQDLPFLKEEQDIWIYANNPVFEAGH